MIAYFILIHHLTDQFERMFKAIYHKHNFYLIHIDGNTDKSIASKIALFLQEFDNAEIFPAVRVMWGGFSLVEAELRGMRRLLQMSANWTHYINLSGQDFPLKYQKYISNFLNKNPGRQYIRAVPQRTKRPETLNRINDIFVEAFGRIFHTGIKRPYLRETSPWIGTQWKIVGRKFCQFVTSDKRVDRIKRFYLHSFIADEAFFQTVIMNIGDTNNFINDDLREIDWVPDGNIKLRPRNFNISDANMLTNGRNLFARKFNIDEDPEIIKFLEDYLESAEAAERSVIDPALRIVDRVVPALECASERFAGQGAVQIQP